MSDTPSNQPPTNGARPPHGRPYQAEEEVSLLDLLLVVARNRYLILGTIVGALLLGALYAYSLSDSYTAEATVVREADGNGGQVQGGRALRGLGLDLGGAGGGIGPGSYPDILETREVRLAVARDTFNFPGEEERMTFVDYVSQPADSSWFDTALAYTIWLPWTVRRALIAEEEREPVEVSDESVHPSVEEERAISRLGAMVGAETASGGFMTVSVTTGDPDLSTELTESFLEHLRSRVQHLRTDQLRQSLEFIEERYQEAEEELYQAEERLADFLDRNRSITSARLENERDRLQRQVEHQAQLHSDLQSQLTQTEIELQRNQPVVTVVEAPVPPSSSDTPDSQFIIIVSLFLGAFLGLGMAFVRAFFRSAVDQAGDDAPEKVDELKQAFIPTRWQTPTAS